MKLRRIELCGFKSFVDRTVVHFDPQVTAIVGPNGCGKSNIVDAIRWAMGEQNARFLRGKAMDEVIFSGSETRSPHGFAEVTLTFDNSDGKGHPDYAAFSELAITRRLSREDSGEYLINGSPCRLRDVTELLLASGVSPRSSMVEQGRMGLIVTARPEERRLLIEEAAGIAKYRIHRKATQRKMDQVRQNLLRVSDVVAEMKRSLASLQRQVGKAQRFKEYREALTELELRVASHRYLELSAIMGGRERELTAAEAAFAQVDGMAAAQEASIAERRAGQQEAEAQLERCHTRSYHCSNLVHQTQSRIEQVRQQLENEIKTEREALLRATALRRREGEQREELRRTKEAFLLTSAEYEQHQGELELRQERLDTVRQQRTAVERELEQSRRRVMQANTAVVAGERALQSLEQRDLEGRERAEELLCAQAEAERRERELQDEVTLQTEALEELQRQNAELAERKVLSEARLREQQLELKTSQLELDEAHRTLTRSRSRLQSLEEIMGRYENLGQGVRSLMRNPEVRERARGVVAEVLDVPSRFEAALAAVLGDGLQDVVVDDIRGAAEVAELISREKLGRAAAVPVQPRASGQPSDLPTGEGIVGPMADFVGCEPQHKSLVQLLLGGVVVVTDLAAALEHWAVAGEARITWVTLAGEVVSPLGRISAGQEEVSLALLQTKREIRRLREEVSGLESVHQARTERVAALQADVAELSGTIDSLRREGHQRELQLVQQQKDLVRARDEVRRQQVESERLAEEARRTAGTVENCLVERDSVLDEISAARQEQAEAETLLTQGQQQLERWRSEEEDALAGATELRVQAAGARERLEAQKSAQQRLTSECDDLRVRLARLVEDQLRSAKAQGQLGGELFAARERLGQLVSDADAARRELEEAKQRLDQLRASLSEDEASLRSVRQEREQRRRETEQLRLDLHEVRVERKSLLDRVEEARQLDLEQVVIDFHLLPPSQPSDLERMEELRRSLDRIGPVNLTAVEEYEELKVRSDESVAQQQDLEQSINHLQRAIQKLNREGRRRFRECFDEVNEHFQKFFPRLFEGGRAHLVLTDENDLLETGVDIVAQPPGKKLGRMELMSGGEKSMTAVSLIFALFKASPSPFTILDEVDAPFDDANVRRYLDVLREMSDTSQFVLVTHSKLSMAESDVLYGVTMEEPGVSKIVSVKLREHDEGRKSAAAA